jgi:hypothetical protein
MIARGSLALVGVLILGTTQGCTRKDGSREEIAYECRDPAVVHASEGSAYRIEIDGADPDPELASMAGRPANPAAGDVVHVGELPVVLDGPGHYRFSLVEESRRVMLSFDGGPPRLVALLVTDAAQLAALGPAERQGLRGVKLDTWSDALGTELARLDLEHVVVAYDQPAAEMQLALKVGVDAANLPFLPPGLPDGLRLLELEVRDSAGPGRRTPLDEAETGISVLSRLSRLRYLAIREASGTFDTAELDLAHLRGLGELEHLRVYSLPRRFVHVEALSALTGLRALDLAGGRGLAELEPIVSLTKLRQLDIRHSDVKSLEALDEHPALEVIDATGAPIAELPDDPPPALRELTLLGTPIAAGDVADFARQAPAARVAHRWNQTLADALACANRIRVRTGGLCHRELADEKLLFEVSDPAEIQAALPFFQVQEDDAMGSCMCCGNPTIEFWRGDQLVTAVGFHHGSSLRWHGWPGDGSLASAGAAGLCGWLAKHGATDACEGRTPLPSPGS